jgi:peptidyl-prolyl cis-trans isomerase SurA
MLRRFTLSSVFVSMLPGAVVIDRVAVIVDKHVIKTSDIQRDLRLTQFINREQLNLSTGAMRQAAERLSDQTLIRDEIARGGYRRPTESEADELVKQLRLDRFGGVDVRMRDELARYGLSESQLREQLLWQLTVLRFIDQRFRVGVQLTDEEVQAYYDQHLTDLKREYPQNNSLAALDPKIRTSLEGERINQNFVEWLDQARKQTRIDYRQGAFQ